MYVLFRVLPYSQNIARALVKPPKVYFFDSGNVSDEERPQVQEPLRPTLL
jgi:predicted AAA+ superfamily ATPase